MTVFGLAGRSWLARGMTETGRQPTGNNSGREWRAGAGNILHRRAGSVAASRAHDPERVEGAESPAG